MVETSYIELCFVLPVFLQNLHNCFFLSMLLIPYYTTVFRGQSQNRWYKTAMSAAMLLNGQHSLTSVERPSHLRSDFVNVWPHARLVVTPVTHVSFASIVHSDLSDDLMFVSMSCLAFSIIPRLIQPRRCRCISLERPVFQCFASKAS